MSPKMLLAADEILAHLIAPSGSEFRSGIFARRNSRLVLAASARSIDCVRASLMSFSKPLQLGSISQGSSDASTASAELERPAASKKLDKRIMGKKNHGTVKSDCSNERLRSGRTRKGASDWRTDKQRRMELDNVCILHFNEMVESVSSLNVYL